MARNQMTPAELLSRRRALGLSQPRFADILGVTERTVRNWEKDATPIPKWLTLALAEIERHHREDIPMARFTTINDVVFAIREADPAFDEELTDEQIRDVIRDVKAWQDIRRYEEITEDDLTEMIVAAYMVTGADETEARRIVN